MRRPVSPGTCSSRSCASCTTTTASPSTAIPSLSFTDDTLKRFAAYGWAVRRVDGHDAADVDAALAWATRSRKPVLIACRTIIGFSAPTKAGTAGSHGSPLGEKEAAAAKSAMGWNHPPFEVPDGIRERWEAAGRRGSGTRRAWLKRLAKHPMQADFERAMAGRLPEAWHEPLAALRATIAEGKPKLATRVSSQKALEALVPAVPEMVGGSADLTGSNNTNVKGIPAVTRGNFAGRYIHWGVREHGMAAAMNGMALHGGIIPYSGTFLVFADYMRPAIRLAALMRQRVIHVLTHDSIGLGEDGPTHQPVETLAGLRCIPNLVVFRPGDAMETAECWELAVKRADGPSVLALSRQNLATFRTDARPKTAAPAAAMCGRGRSLRAPPRNADRHRFGSRDRDGRPGRRWPPRASRSRWSRLPCVGAVRRSRMPATATRCWAMRAAHRHRGRDQLRLGPLARPRRRVHRHDRLRRLGPGRGTVSRISASRLRRSPLRCARSASAKLAYYPAKGQKENHHAREGRDQRVRSHRSPRAARDHRERPHRRRAASPSTTSAASRPTPTCSATTASTAASPARSRFPATRPSPSAITAASTARSPSRPSAIPTKVPYPGRRRGAGMHRHLHQARRKRLRS